MMCVHVNYRTLLQNQNNNNKTNSFAGGEEEARLMLVWL